MVHEDTLYEVLEVSTQASTLVIRAAYRCLVQLHHPDHHQGDALSEERLVRINHAYWVLSDPGMRLRYDRSIGVHLSSRERRRVPVDGTDLFGSVSVGAQQARPFAFRPLA